MHSLTYQVNRFSKERRIRRYRPQTIWILADDRKTLTGVIIIAFVAVIQDSKIAILSRDTDSKSEDNE